MCKWVLTVQIHHKSYWMHCIDLDLWSCHILNSLTKETGSYLSNRMSHTDQLLYHWSVHQSSRLNTQLSFTYRKMLRLSQVVSEWKRNPKMHLASPCLKLRSMSSLAGRDSKKAPLEWAIIYILQNLGQWKLFSIVYPQSIPLKVYKSHKWLSRYLKWIHGSTHRYLSLL